MYGSLDVPAIGLYGLHVFRPGAGRLTAACRWNPDKSDNSRVAQLGHPKQAGKAKKSLGPPGLRLVDAYLPR